MAQRKDAAVDRVVADDLAVPCPLDEPIARDDLAATLGEGDQHLHNPRLDIDSSAVGDERALGRNRPNGAKLEGRHAGEIDCSLAIFRREISHERQ